MSGYVSSSRAASFSCTGCGHKITCTPGHFRSWRSISCSRCVAASGFYSYGELLVGACLSSAGIRYDCQMTLRSDCGRVMYADFYLPEQGVVIEYHGEQHYSDGRFSHRRSISEQRKRDSDLKEVVLGLGLGYVEIPYTINTIELVASALARATGIDVDVEAARAELRMSTRISDVVSFYSSHDLGSTLDRFGLSRSTIDRWFADAVGCTKRECTKRQARRLISEDPSMDWETAQEAILNTTGELRKRSYVLILMREARDEQQA